ncbi:hypothetical protein OJF2_49060 [Aquisphaera giovannonii]|uniref:Uncharacterized protein n=1 Tax=Aquisphaera giovannonii TaxID=406548 RepID=A0A5B9W8D7_9BACT|nr:hypothetical protein [Aquisphaera giovannonii]QEH36345.1 hypothetical protein OJF2_49060 [Aquisphaera giovannonii]
MIDVEREPLRKTYQLCRISFFFLSLCLVPACLHSILNMAGLLGDPRLLFWLAATPIDDWVGTITVWSSLIGTMLLWGRWGQKGWQRRVALLLVMCLADLVLWFMERGAAQVHGRLGWFPQNLGRALGWAEFALLAGLMGDYLVHLGVERADESARSIRSLAATGAVVWMLHFCESTNWNGGWPLQGRMPGRQGILLYLGWNMIWTICLIQVSALAVAALRHSSRVLGEMEKEDMQDDPFAMTPDSTRHDFYASMPTHGADPF